MTQKRSTKQTDVSVEEKATSWPPSEYREWVQSQIASKMLFRLGGITVISLLALLTGAYSILQSFQERLSKSAAISVQDSLLPELQKRIELEVRRLLFDHSELVERASEDALAALNEKIPTIVKQDSFVEPATEIVFKEIQEGGGSQRIILDEAYNRVFDNASAESTRALALRIYALFHPSVRAHQEIDPLKQTINSLIETDRVEAALPSLLIETALQHYPIGIIPTILENSDCGSGNSKCDTWDFNILNFVLSLDVDQRLSRIDDSVLQDFFSRLPISLAEHAFNWIQDKPDNRLARLIPTSLLRAHDPDVLAFAVERVADFSVSTENPRLSDLALSSLSALDPEAMISSTARISALRKMWSILSQDALNLAFSDTELGLQVSEQEPRRQGNARSSLRSLLASDNNLSARERSLFRRRQDDMSDGTDIEKVARVQVAVVSLLRTENDKFDQEWNIVFRTTIGRELSIPSLVALAMRLHRDAREGTDVSKFSDQLLDATSTYGDTTIQVRALALQYSSEPRFTAATNNYRQQWLKRKAPPYADIISRTVLRRYRDTDPSLVWLGKQFDDDGPSQSGYEEHLLNTIAVDHGIDNPNIESTPLQSALGAVISHDHSASHWDSLLEILLKELVNLADTDYWHAALVGEDSGILAFINRRKDDLVQSSNVTALLNMFPWIGIPPDDSIEKITFVSAQEKLIDIPKADTTKGNWFRVDSQLDRPLRIANYRGIGEIVVFDVNRSNVLARTSGNNMSDTFMLPAGEYALHVRSRDAEHLTVGFSEAEFLTINTKETTKKILPGTHYFWTGDNTGNGWYDIEIGAGESIAIETKPSDVNFDVESELSRSRLDTMIALAEGESDEILVSNDDYEDKNLYSKLEYYSDKARSLRILITDAGGDLPAGVAFRVIITITKS